MYSIGQYFGSMSSPFATWGVPAPPPTLSPFRPLPSPFGFGSTGYDGNQIDVTPAKPLVELEMTRFSAALREKPSWWIKFRDETILDRWRSEALEQAQLMRLSHIDYVLKELDGYAMLRDNESGAEVSCYDKIWQSDTLVPESLNRRLIEGAAKLENVPDSEKDWHPRSNGQVLDLVHPSLYPIVYNRTLAYSTSTSELEKRVLSPIQMPPLPEPVDRWDKWEGTEDTNYHISHRFQWLPTDFKISSDGNSAGSIEYINNLDPGRYPDIHSTIEDLVAAFVPLFERVLTDSIPENHAVPERVPNQYSYNETYAPEPEWSQHLDDDQNEAIYKQWASGRPYFGPDVRPMGYEMGSLERRKFRYKLAGKTIQVIVKMANIYLTPENPVYQGGSWHVEGMWNEAIAVSGIYYYDEDNISESRLAFRTAAAMPFTYDQGDERGCRLTWGVGKNEPMVNNLGSVRTSPGRAIAFPNLYQHRVSPFELRDKTKSGHRKILALFLVDPAIERPSTTTVPPQQNEQGGMSRQEAEAYRIELMSERTAFVRANDEKFFNVAFSMCEH
ncbi:hypothetical protein RhiJN_20070 [Ceratobasidium sp. AG-Ba]|nr:hypothetical protein RhiJN_20070 [Ceratobasidium sp. AG-Ba]